VLAAETCGGFSWHFTQKERIVCIENPIYMFELGTIMLAPSKTPSQDIVEPSRWRLKFGRMSQSRIQVV
jgi:hypothetical protein